jgi:hypothetical protein
MCVVVNAQKPFKMTLSCQSAILMLSPYGASRTEKACHD